MARDTAIAEKLRAAGLAVVEVAGWQTRGSDSFAPRGFVWHHTAGPRTGNAPSLAICIYGRAGLPGPLCNVFLARDGTVYVVAAGRANHAGTGSWAGLSGNSSVYGLEVENTGTGDEPWQPFLVDIAARIAAALATDHERCCHHKEWTSRKVDMHTLSGRDMRARVAQLHAPAPRPPSQPTEFTPPPGGPMRFFITDPAFGIRLVLTDGHCVMDWGVTRIDQLRPGDAGGPMSPASFAEFCAKYPGGRTVMGLLP